MSITAARSACSTHSGALVQTLGAGELQDGMGVAVDSRTGDVFAVDGASDKVDVFVPEAAGRPVVEDVTARERDAQRSAAVGADRSGRV